MTDIKTHNDLVFAMAKRAKELLEQNMPELRMSCSLMDTDHGRKQDLIGETKGDLIEMILIDEFDLEHDRDFSED